VTLPTIFGHKDVGSTACPGRYGYGKLAEIRTLANVSGNSAFVRALYQDMMLRTPDDAGLNGWTAALSSGKQNRRTVSHGFSFSSEYRMLIIGQAYRQVLNRDPDAAGAASWVNGLARGWVRLDNLRPTLMATEEFFLRGGSSDAQFVNNIYLAALGRNAAPSEVSAWAGVRRKNGPQAVIAAVWGSPEAGMRRVDEAYHYYLGRNAAPSEQQGWLPVVTGSGDERLREELIVSEEYFGKARSRFP
jgi:hypothetical protein